MKPPGTWTTARRTDIRSTGDPGWGTLASNEVGGTALKQLRRVAAINWFRLKSFASRFRWIIVGGTLAVLSIWDLMVKLPEPLMISTAAAGLVLVAFDLGTHLRAWRSTDFVPRDSETFRDLAIDDHPPGRHTLWEYPNGTFAYDEQLSSAIEAGLAGHRKLHRIHTASTAKQVGTALY